MHLIGLQLKKELKIKWLADYVLRAMNVPAGKHSITFKFEPGVVETGSTIALVGTVLFGLILLGGIGYEYKKRK